MDGFACAAGTGGTIGGVAPFLKEKNPDVVVWLADPQGSALDGLVNDNARGVDIGEPIEVEGQMLTLLKKPTGSTIAEGVGIDRRTANFARAQDANAIDGSTVVTDHQIIDMAYYLLRHDGVFVGPSAALNVVAAVQLARTLGPGKTVVTILCDGGARYSSKMYNKEWLVTKKLKPGPPQV